MAKLSPFASTYLNLMRGAAASAVVLFHFKDKHFGPEWITRFFPSNGHGFVIVFFVLSGFLISMAAENKNARDFTIDRAVRILIVAIPILLFSAALSILAPDISDYPEDVRAATQPLSTFLLNVSFLSQSWNFNQPPYLDGPYWSLSYEVIYYLIFGMIFYARGIARWLLSAAVCAVAGPKILILFPCWLAGVAAYKFRNMRRDDITFGWLAAIGAPALLVTAFALGFKSQLNSASIFFDQTPSEGFLRSWAVALTVAVHLWGICRINLRWPRFVEIASRQLAEMSFSIYLAHLPFLYLLAHYFIDPRTAFFVIAGLPLTFFFCFLVAMLIERNTKRVRDAILVSSGRPLTASA